MRLSIIIGFCLLLSVRAFGGVRSDSDTTGTRFISSGDLRTDLLSLSNRPLESPAVQGNNEVQRKSPFLAAALSGVLPGAGEFYTESYWRSALFIAAEAALWTVNLSYNKKGDNKENFYKQYADQHWSVVRYAEWINANFSTLTGGLDPSQYVINIDQNGTLPPWQRVDWNAVHRAENAIGGGFSHSLAPYGDQQYYEMIGKYMQFVHGWDETNFNVPTYIDQVTPQLRFYAGERGKANDYYNVASTAATIIVVNHVLSAVDAVLSTHSYNAVHSEVSVRQLQTPVAIYYIPTLRVSVGF